MTEGVEGDNATEEAGGVDVGSTEEDIIGVTVCCTCAADGTVSAC